MHRQLTGQSQQADQRRAKVDRWERLAPVVAPAIGFGPVVPGQDQGVLRDGAGPQNDNPRLKRIVADPRLDHEILQDAIGKTL